MHNNDKLNRIYEKTDGYCHICHKKLSFKNYDSFGAKGSWHIEHSVARANGGSDHLNNLYPACIGCNLDKGTLHTKTARSYYGNTRAPYSKKKKDQIRKGNTSAGVVLGAAVGTAIGGPLGAVIGGVFGGVFGNSRSPKK